MKLDGDPSACNARLHRRCRRVNGWHRVAYGDFRRPGQKTRIDQLAGDRGHSHSGAIKLLGCKPWPSVPRVPQSSDMSGNPFL